MATKRVTRRLLIVDHYEWETLAKVDATRDTSACDVLVVGRSAEWLRLLHGTRLDPRRWHLIDPTPWAAGAHESVRQAVLDIVPTLPGRRVGSTTLGELFAGNGSQSWWHLEITEKGPYRGPLVEQLYRLALVREALTRGAYAEWCHSLVDRELAAVMTHGGGRDIPPLAAAQRPPLLGWPRMRYLVHAVRAVVRGLAARFVASMMALPIPEAGSDATFTLFPEWWAGAWTNNPRDRFFSPHLSRRPQSILAWLGDPFGVMRAYTAVRASFDRMGVIPLQEFLRLSDVCALLSLRRFLRFSMFLSSAVAAVTQQWRGWEVGGLVVADLVRSWSGAEAFQNPLIERSVARAVSVARPARVIYRCEFQPTEHALLRGIAGAVRTYGFVHFPFGRRYLAMQFSPLELDTRPMPDGILATSADVRTNVIASGYPESRTAVCGPLRYGGLAAYLEHRPSRAALRATLGLSLEGTVVLVAFAIVEGDSEALSAAILALAAAQPDITFLIRTHPNLPQGAPVTKRLLGLLAGRAIVVGPEAALYDYLAAADVLAGVGSMIAFEAMALGVMPVMLESPSSYAATSLRAYDAGMFIVTDGQGLCRALEAIRVNSEVAQQKAAAWVQLVPKVLGPVGLPLGPQLDAAYEALERPERSSL